jgi:hypothetical protein
MARATTWFVRLRHRAGSFLGQYPAIYLPAARLSHRLATTIDARRTHQRNPDARPPPLGPSTDVVIEGFPRSANTFAVAAFRLAQPADVRIAHHRHAPAQVLGAAKIGVPALVLIREPEEAILSYVTRHPEIGMRQALKDYIRFYERVLPHRGRFVCATFKEVTSDFARVTRRLNDRFGTSFEEFVHTDEHVQEVFRRMDRYHAVRFGGEETFASMGARPSDERIPLMDAQRAEFHGESLSQERARAHALYEILARPEADSPR